MLASLALLIAACAAVPRATDKEEITPAPAASPTAAPAVTTTASPASPPSSPAARPTLTPDAPYVPEVAVRIDVDNLRMRQGPSTSSRILGSLDHGDVLVLEGWPETNEGYVWYFATRVATDGAVHDLSGFRSDASPLSGFVAVRKGSVDYVVLLPPRCPTTPDLVSLSGMLTSERLACFGGRTLKVEGVFGCYICGLGAQPGSFEPGWLAGPNLNYLLVDSRGGGVPLQLHFSPSGPPRPVDGSIIRVRGHFDDPAALSCVVRLPKRVDGDPLYRVDPALAIGHCRQAFVVESYEILGTDPEFPHD
jgi:hypothetical protein